MKSFYMHRTGQDIFQVHLCDGQDASCHMAVYTPEIWEITRQKYKAKGYVEMERAPISKWNYALAATIGALVVGVVIPFFTALFKALV